MKLSCRNCKGLDMEKKEIRDGRLKGLYRYGCRSSKSGYICGFLSCDENLEGLLCEKWSGKEQKQGKKRGLAKEYGDRIQELFDRWMQWKEAGCPGAEVPDGIYLNRVRDSIGRMRQKIEAEISEEDYPEGYYALLPPIMEEGYMANSTGIRRAANRALLEYESNEDFLWLCQHMRELEGGTSVETETYRLLCHADKLREAIQSADLFRMKQGSRHENLYEELAACRKEVQNQIKKRKGRSRKKSGGRPLVGQMELTETKAS